MIPISHKEIETQLTQIIQSVSGGTPVCIWVLHLFFCSLLPASYLQDRLLTSQFCKSLSSTQLSTRGDLCTAEKGL